MSFPSTLSSFNRPSATDRLNSPSHSALHNTVSSAVGQLEAVIGLADSGSTLGTIIGDLRSPNSPGGGHVQTANVGGTGQTTYTKGDILIASSSSVLSKLSVSTNGYALIADSTQPAGVTWGVPNSKPTIRVFTTSSVFTYSKPSILSYIRVKIVGGGGGPGGGVTFGGAGGGASYGEKVIIASSVATTTQIVVAAAGVTGSVGGTTAFGSIVTAAGGSPGSDDPGGGSTTGGGAGGTASGSDINFVGEIGFTASRSATVLAAPGGRPFIGTFGRGATSTGSLGTLPATNGAIIIEEY